jgi:hypothetical protein
VGIGLRFLSGINIGGWHHSVFGKWWSHEYGLNLLAVLVRVLVLMYFGSLSKITIFLNKHHLVDGAEILLGSSGFGGTWAILQQKFVRVIFCRNKSISNDT